MAVASWFAIDLDLEEAAERYPAGAVLRDASGRILRVTLGEGDADCRPSYRASPDDWIVKAIVASEDGTFWTHRGVRPGSVLRALWQNVTGARRVSGASTITMQTVRLIKPHKKTYLQKWIEMVKAVKLERAKDKLWILSQYLNRAPFGANFIGVEAAAQGWFGKSAKSLGPGEAAMLAGMVQSPSRFRPDRGYVRALARRDYVLSRMFALGTIDKAGMEGARSVLPEVSRTPRPFLHPHFCDVVLKELSKDGKPPAGDFTTALDSEIQAACVSAVAQVAEGRRAAAAVVVRVSDGAIVALATSEDYFSGESGRFNVATARRSAGSTLKPFLAAMAMDSGLATPRTAFLDLPKSYKGYKPVNFDARYRGMVTLREALVLSLNIPFVAILEKAGVSNFIGVLEKSGFAGVKADDADTLGLGLAIGNAGVSLLELARAYAVIARGGTAVDGERVFSEESAYLVSDMLSGEERSLEALGHAADAKLPRFAWKTGTSSGYRDAWTVAWNPKYAIGVWAGRVDGGFCGTSNTGAAIAAPAAWKIARATCPSGEGPWYARPAGICERKVCALTGLLPNADCPRTVDDLAIASRSSPRRCGAHARDFDGKPVERLDGAYAAFAGKTEAAEKLSIVRPGDGTEFETVEGVPQQKIVFEVSGNPEGEKLWWFDNGRLAGTSEGREKFAASLAPGRHAVVCSTAAGVTAETTVTVH